MGAEHLMQCMEVWGGNRAVNNGVVMPGIDAWVYSQPFEGHEAGGDVHYVSSCATGRITRVLVADVAGHGELVAETADRLRHLMRKYINYLDQTRFVSRMNTAFQDAGMDGRFATAVVATYWAPASLLTVSNAGHPRPMIFTARNRAWSFIGPKTNEQKGPINLPLGVERPTTYDEVSVPLRCGDLVLFYSDSLTEARFRAGRVLGEDGLLEALNAIDASQPQSLVRALLAELRRRGIGESLDDDVTTLLIRRNELALRMRTADIIGNGWRLAGRMARAATGHGGPIGWPEMSKEVIGGLFWRRLNKKAPE
jgi:serine phosphatase RsbU (regulator of sigma subunit)